MEFEPTTSKDSSGGLRNPPDNQHLEPSDDSHQMRSQAAAPRRGLLKPIKGEADTGPIPARAGEPINRWIAAAFCRTYPRSRGGTHGCHPATLNFQGLSPLARGNPARIPIGGQHQQAHHGLAGFALGLAASQTLPGLAVRREYEAFVDTIVQRMNARTNKLLVIERSMLKSLPVRRTAEFEEIPARVSKYSIFTVKGAQYSTPSQLIGHRLMVRQYAEHIECWLGGQCVLSRPRARPGDGQRHGRAIDYRHLVGALKRKPGAFARWVLRDAAFPRAVLPKAAAATQAQSLVERSLEGIVA